MSYNANTIVIGNTKTPDNLLSTDIYGYLRVSTFQAMDLLHGDITSTVLKGFYSVANALPFGLDKNFYCNALDIELQLLSLRTHKNRQQTIFFKDHEIGQLTFDIVVNNCVLLHIISEKEMILTEQVDSAKNYLKLSDFEVLLLLNFGQEADHKRIILTNNYKPGGE